MPLPLPKLDNRTFDQLVAEGRNLIPRLAPGWTDHNFHDPGMTLLDLFAWLVEMDLYRLDRISEASYRGFLRMLGFEPKPLQVAETVLVFEVSPPHGPTTLPAGLQVGTVDGSVIFQTQQALTVSPARLTSILCGPEDALQRRPLARQPRAYPSFGTRAAVNDALYLGFDLPLGAKGQWISLYVWTGAPEADRGTRARLITEWQAASEEARETCPPGAEPDVPDWRQHYSARTVWEYFAAPGQWTALQDVSDETRGLTLSGPVRFRAPGKQTPGGVDAAGLAAQFFIRCRLLSGGYECPPETALVALNAVGARHAADRSERLGASTGRAGQTFSVQSAPVVPGSTQLEARVDALPAGDWEEALAWDRVGPHDRNYLLSPETGEITFGDGRVGRVPPARAELHIAYQVGGGPEGNVGGLGYLLPGAHNEALVQGWNQLRPTLSATQPFPASGGAPAEPLSSAKARLLEWLDEAQRAVTLDDFEALALATPGVPVARAHAIADYDPAMPCLPALGCVTVVVVPRCPDPRPEPGPAMLQAVARYLHRRRTLTTALRVVGPSYVTVSVRATLHAAPDVEAKALSDAARDELDRFFHPLHGGPEGAGWPVSRDVYRSEVLAVLNSLPGVTHVDDVSLDLEDEPGARCGNVSVCPHSLVVSGVHHITVAGGNACDD